MPTQARDFSDRAEDAMTQIARLRDQVESLMRDKVSRVVEGGEKFGAAARRGGRCDARPGGEPRHHGASAAAGGDPRRRRRWVPPGTGGTLNVASVSVAADRPGGRGAPSAPNATAHGVSCGLWCLRDGAASGRCAVRSCRGLVLAAEALPARIVGLIFAGIDLVLALILAWLALRSSPGKAEREALAIRERALEDATELVSMSALLIRGVDLVMRFSRPK